MFGMASKHTGPRPCVWRPTPAGCWKKNGRQLRLWNWGVPCCGGNGMGCIVGYPWLSYDFSLELVEKCALHHVHSCFTRGRNGLRSCRRIIVMKSHDCRRLGGRAWFNDRAGGGCVLVARCCYGGLWNCFLLTQEFQSFLALWGSYMSTIIWNYVIINNNNSVM